MIPLNERKRKRQERNNKKGANHIFYFLKYVDSNFYKNVICLSPILPFLLLPLGFWIS